MPFSVNKFFSLFSNQDHAPQHFHALAALFLRRMHFASKGLPQAVNLVEKIQDNADALAVDSKIMLQVEHVRRQVPMIIRHFTGGASVYHYDVPVSRTQTAVSPLLAASVAPLLLTVLVE